LRLTLCSKLVLISSSTPSLTFLSRFYTPRHDSRLNLITYTLFSGPVL
jgi:hypothetical protein